jgi:hypothetical protein
MGGEPLRQRVLDGASRANDLGHDPEKWKPVFRKDQLHKKVRAPVVSLKRLRFRASSAISLGNTARTRVFGGSLPRPAALDFCFQRETEESADADDRGQEPDALKGKRSGDG